MSIDQHVLGATDAQLSEFKRKLAALNVDSAPPYRFEPGRAPTMESIDGKVYVRDPMPEYLEFSLHLIAMPLPGLEVRGDVIDMRLANGRYVYRIVESREETESVVGHLEYSE